MHPSKKIEVEPLSDARWSKIEGAIFEELDRERPKTRATEGDPGERMRSAPPPRSRRWRGAHVGVALVMAGAMAAAVGALASRTFWVSPVASPPVASAPSRIVTSGSESRLALGESEVDVAPESAVLVSGDDDRGVLVVLDRGKVDCTVAPRKGRPPFVVQAGDVRVSVVGTHFSVQRDDASGGAHVIVAVGIVEVTTHGRTTTVHAGETWPGASEARADQASPAAPPADVNGAPPEYAPPDALALAPHRAGTSKSARSQKPSITRPLSAPWPGSASTSAASSSLASSPSSASDAPLPEPVNAPPVSAPPAPPESAPSAAAQPAPSVLAPQAAPTAPAPVVPSPPSPQDLYESAARMEGQNPDGALALYRRVAPGSGAWSANALYAAGRLQAERGRRSDAQKLLGEYLARFPNGPNAADARDLLQKTR